MKQKYIINNILIFLYIFKCFIFLLDKFYKLDLMLNKHFKNAIKSWSHVYIYKVVFHYDSNKLICMWTNWRSTMICIFCKHISLFLLPFWIIITVSSQGNLSSLHTCHINIKMPHQSYHAISQKQTTIEKKDRKL